jgi:hypothetical protein
LPDKYHDDVPVLEKAKNLVKTKNLDPNEGIVKNFDTVLDTPDATLIDIASIVGVSLGCSLDMISENLTLLRAHEEARDCLFKASRASRDVELDPKPTILQSMVVDSVLQEMLALTQDELEEINSTSLGQFQLAENF